MKKNLKILFLSIFVISFICMNNYAYAASVSMYANSKSLNVGKSTSIVVNGNSIAGKFSIVSSNSNVISLSTDSLWVEGSTSCTAYAKSTGTATITIKPIDVSDSDANDVTSSIGPRSISIKVNQNQSVATTKTSSPTTSDNANLKDLTIESFNIDPEFSKNILQYNLKVDSNVNDLNITATPDDAKASVDITGNKDLKEGDNTIKIVVTATDKKTTKEYTIIVNKAQDLSKAYLKSLTLSEGKLEPAFKEDTFSYNLTDVSDDTNSIDVKAIPKFDDSKVEINGADNLNDNNNKMTIKVSSADGKITKNYVISVSRSQEYYESLKNSKISKKDKILNFFTNQKNLIVILYIFVLIEFLQILYLYAKVKKVDTNNDNKVNIKRTNNIDNVAYKKDKEIKVPDKSVNESKLESKEELENHVGRRRGNIRGNYKDKF